LPDASIDIIITDPPFGINYFDEQANYDVNPNIFFEVEDELFRVLKNNSWLIFWWSIKCVPDIAKLKKFQYRWQIICEFQGTYSKSMIGDRKYIPIYVYAKGDSKMIYRATDIVYGAELPFLQVKIKSGDFKPTIAQSQLLCLFTREDDLILDPFCGFGSLLMVCKLFNRRFIGIDNDEVRVKIARKLLKEMKMSKSLPEMIKEIKTGYKSDNNLFSQ